MDWTWLKCVTQVHVSRGVVLGMIKLVGGGTCEKGAQCKVTRAFIAGTDLGKDEVGFVFGFGFSVL